MKRLILLILMALCVSAFAKGGFSGGGGGRGGFASSRPSFSAPRTPSYSSPAQPRVTTQSTTTTTRSSVGGGGIHYGPGMAYGGMGMGYGYSNGMLTGLLIGNMLHPNNTVVYSGPGNYGNNALLYPDGRVVSSSGQLVGNYANGSFTAVENGAIVAQSVPSPQPQPVVIRDSSAEIFVAAMLVAVAVFIFILIVI